ncbi:hypothetical protein BaRGS_00011061, partial [Batillaria attramentaria]
SKAWSVWSDSSDPWWHQFCRLESHWDKIDYNCVDMRFMGNWPVCFDSHLVPEKNCIVYSFGIDYDFRFDDAMAAAGCTVFSFDPSMNVSDHQRSKQVTFKAIGLSGTDNDMFSPRLNSYVTSPTTWRMRRLSSIMKQLGHREGDIAVIKIDIEGSEWDVVHDLLGTGSGLASVPQLLIEWHAFTDFPPRSRYTEMLRDYATLESAGFRKFWTRDEGRTHFIGRLHSQAETAFVNSHYLSGP